MGVGSLFLLVLAVFGIVSSPYIVYGLVQWRSGNREDAKKLWRGIAVAAIVYTLLMFSALVLPFLLII